MQVVATHQYQGEDDDELSFQKGAVIYVVPYEDPDDEVCYYTAVIILYVAKEHLQQ